MINYERRYPIIQNKPGDGNNTLNVTVYYSYGGYSYFNYKNYPRGYYIRFREEKVGEFGTMWTGFSGKLYFIAETKRYSAKGFAAARAKLDSTEMLQKMTEYCNSHGYIIGDTYTEREIQIRR